MIPLVSPTFAAAVLDRATAPGGNAHADPVELRLSSSMRVRDVKQALAAARPTIPGNRPLRLVFCGEDLNDDRTLGSYNVHSGATAHLVVSRASAPLLFTKTSSGLTATFVTKAGHCDAESVHVLRQAGGVGGAPHLTAGLAELLARRPELRFAMGDVGVDAATGATASAAGAEARGLGAAAPAMEEPIPASAESVPAEYLAATVTVHSFGLTVDPSLGNRRPTLLVVGGVHGNETCGMLGVEALCQYLRSGVGRLARHLLSHARIVAVPCANRVGMLCAR